MPTRQTEQWIALTVTPIMLLLGTALQPIPLVMAQPNPSAADACQTIRYRPEVSGPDHEWIRVERCGDRVRVIPTRRGNENRGVLGVVNVVTDLTGPRAGFSRWYDHPVTRLAFQPDRCSDIGSAAPANCAITGTEDLLFPADASIHDGQFTVEYTDGDLLRTVTFRLPTEDN